MRRKFFIIISILFCVFFGKIEINYAATACSKEAVEELGKLVYSEYGGDLAKNPNDNMFIKLNVASIAINNASKIKGNTWKEKIYNLPDYQYESHSKYKIKSYEQVVDKSRRGEIAYISALVLSGKYNLPKNMIGQASCRCLLGGNAKECQGVDTNLSAYDCTAAGWAKVWTHVETVSGAFDAYFGYANNEELSNTDVFNKKATTSVDYYKQLATNYKKSDYTSYTTENVCSKVSGITTNTPNNSQNNSDKPSKTHGHVCENTEILKVIQFFLILVDIVKIIIPIALIILGIIDLSKAVINSDEENQKKTIKLFIKKIVYGILVFAVPWIVEVVTITLGNALGDSDTVNFTDCLENANQETIEKLEKASSEW